MSLINVITGYTPDYEAHAVSLVASGRKHDVNVHAYRHPDVRDWLEGTRIKASIILGAMHEFEGPVLWLDADAEILRPLCQITLRQWQTHYDFCAPAVMTNRKRVFYVATMWFKNDVWDRQLVGRWRDYCKRAKPHEGDEWLLEKARSDMVNEGAMIRYGFMPYSWSWVPGCDHDRKGSFVAHSLSGSAGEYVKSLSEEQKREVGL